MTEPANPSPRLLRALAPFGVSPDTLGSAATRSRSAAEIAAARLAAELDRAGPGTVALITGPSGSGKSTLLAHLAAAAPGAAVLAHRVRLDPARAVAEHRASVPIDDWLGVLSAAGLADARVLATPAGRLSDGEAARLRLAVAMADAERGGLDSCLLVDECCTPLDRDTAAGVAAALHRWASRTGIRVVAASAHADLEALLGPGLVARCAPGGQAVIEPGPGRPSAPAVRIEPGTTADYAVLARHHYRAGRPASPCRVLRAVADTSGGLRLAGVLVVSHPTLNGAWREMIWPGRYVGVEKRRLARRLNREVRRISRVIVDPRDRGRGVARALVRAYLDDPDTPATEAVSAMGRLSPFGRRAGMAEYPLPPRPADDRLADVLAARGIEPWELLDPARTATAIADGLVAWEIERWGRAVWSSVPKPVRATADARTLAPLAAARLCAPPVAYGAVVE